MGGRSNNSRLARGFASASVALGVTLASATGCRQVAGIDDRQASPHCSSASFVDGACGECTDLHCCAALADCAAQATCASDLACLAACATTDSTCRAHCANAGTLGPKLAAVLACQTSRCGASCGGRCGAPLATSDVCAACLENECCSQSSACSSSSDCTARSMCEDHCADAGCARRCALAFPEAATDAPPFASCKTERCSAECGAWFCRGAAPTPSAPRVTLTLVVKYAIAPNGSDGSASGFVVHACSKLDTACITSPSTASVVDVTDSTGAAQFDVAPGFDGSFSIEDPSAAFVPTVVRTVPALLRSTTIPVFVVRPEQLSALAAAGGAALDPAAGVVTIHARDCFDREAAGVHYRLANDAGAPFYFRKGQLGPPGSQATDGQRSIAGFVNLPPFISVSIRGDLATAAPEPVVSEIIATPLPGIVTFVDLVAAR